MARLLLLAACAALFLGTCIRDSEAWGSPAPPPAPTESECRPYIEKALKEMEHADATGSHEDGGGESAETTEQADQAVNEDVVDTTAGIEGESIEEGDSTENEGDASKVDEQTKEQGGGADSVESTEEGDQGVSAEADDSTETSPDSTEGSEAESAEGQAQATEDTTAEESAEEPAVKADSAEEVEAAPESTEDQPSVEDLKSEDADAMASTEESDATAASKEESEEPAASDDESEEANTNQEEKSGEEGEVKSDGEEATSEEVKSDGEEATSEEVKGDGEEASEEAKSGEEEVKSGEEEAKSGEEDNKSDEETTSGEKGEEGETKSDETTSVEKGEEGETKSDEDTSGEKGEEGETKSDEDTSGEKGEEGETKSDEDTSGEKGEEGETKSDEDTSGEKGEEVESAEETPAEESPEEDLTMEIEIPENLRPRDHIAHILKLDDESAETELLLQKTVETTLRELKRLYDTAIKPLEMLYKYRDLSNRHFGDAEIFSKPLVLFMGPWSGGKSTIINYLLDNEYKQLSLRTGAEPSPAYFNILMHGAPGERQEILDGTQLAADSTFSGLQKFGQGLLDRLRGVRLNNPLLEKVNIVEIPGILEIRKQVERLFPFNDACQWFIDRADIIFLVYDPSKLDVGPETEAILDQLKGREYQTRIILNKADQVKPEELMRVQGTLIWNISPLMSSAEPPVMYSTSLWSMPYELGAPVRLLQAQEHAFLRDLRETVTKRVENKIASARRFAVRVRNHAKMVDCYLTTYYNHKTFFGNKKKTADDIIEHPQDYHIYEGLSTLTNISRYDLPDPETYRDFFKLNPLFDFQQLAATCTYFRGCPINRLDVAIAYDLPELVGKYKKSVEETLEQVQKTQPKS